MKKIVGVMFNILTFFLIIIFAFTAFSLFQAKRNPNSVPTVLGYKPLSVLSGSMQPLLDPGDMIIVRDTNPQDVKVGDVITYLVDSKTLVTHRVIDIFEENGDKSFKTQGDANNTADPNLVSSSNLVGKLSFNIPYGGYVASFAKSPKGFILFIIFPTIILIGLLIKDLISEVEKDKKKKTTPPDTIQT